MLHKKATPEYCIISLARR